MGTIGQAASQTAARIRPVLNRGGRSLLALLVILWGGLWLPAVPDAQAERVVAPSEVSSGEIASPSASKSNAPRPADASDIPTETVSQFVEAYLKVVDLVEQREIDLQRAETEAVSLQIQREIQAEAFGLIEAAGLTRQQYWQLLSLANVDPNFRERVLAQVEEASL